MQVQVQAIQNFRTLTGHPNLRLLNSSLICSPRNQKSCVGCTPRRRDSLDLRSTRRPHKARDWLARESIGEIGSLTARRLRGENGGESHLVIRFDALSDCICISRIEDTLHLTVVWGRQVTVRCHTVCIHIAWLALEVLAKDLRKGVRGIVVLWSTLSPQWGHHCVS